MTDSENSAGEPKKSFWVTLLRPKVALPLGLLVLILLSPVLYRGWNLGHIPDLGDPFLEQPPSKPKLPEDNNAWVNYRKADELWEKQTEIANRTPRRGPVYLLNFGPSGISIWRKSLETSDPLNLDGFFPTAETMTRDLNLYREALEEWKTGTGKSRYDLEERDVTASLRGPSFDPVIRIWDPDRGPAIEQLAIARAGQLASQGKPSEALEW
ncbi:MAG TPA: hypothetical protein VLA12_09290, partial [Planctomycetaceae bacterium]|nr:hypothetical protein [Planctomycetaceae bacterium]